MISSLAKTTHFGKIGLFTILRHKEHNCGHNNYILHDHGDNIIHAANHFLAEVCNNNNILRFTRCANLNKIIKMLRTELYTLTLSVYIYIILRFIRCADLNTIIKMLRTELYTLTL